MYQAVLLDGLGKAGILQATLKNRIRDLQLDPDTTIEFLGPNDLHQLSSSSIKVGVLFSDGPVGKKFETQVKQLLDSPAVVVPAVTSLENFGDKVPDCLRATNGLLLDPADTHLETLAALVLELLGLLRKRRRLFISYKRSESSDVAQQLYHALDERSFDVFLDTLSVRAADAFQEQLWHRMTDSDVVILLYTKSIHDSSWVEKEIDRASDMKVTVLQIIWPGVDRDPKTQLFEPLYLEDKHFEPARPQTLQDSKLSEICTLVEGLRARSLANREAELIGTLRDRAAFHKLPTAIQRTRSVDVYCAKNQFTRVIPVIGVPDSESFHAGALAPPEGVQPVDVVVLYDSANIAPAWCKHLDWLDKYLPLKTLKASDADKWLGNLCP
jgi:hypothetical protein